MDSRRLKKELTLVDLPEEVLSKALWMAASKGRQIHAFKMVCKSMTRLIGKKMELAHQHYRLGQR
jgi:hypothetical protein